MSSNMRILIFNWRDIKNPTSGGAEILTHELARRWVERGNKVVMFCSFYKNAKQKESVDGVEIIREGNPDARHLWNSVHFKAFINYKRKFKGNFDVVIDEIHGIPFFTPLYVKEKKVALICEVAGRIWDISFPFPFNLLGKYVEKNYFKFYKNINFLTISNSTKDELLGFGVERNKITVLPMGITKPSALPKFKKEKVPTIIFVARLVRSKGVEDAVSVCKILEKEFPDIKLWIVGPGEESYVRKLKNKVQGLRLEENISFFGFVSQSKKFELMQKAHILIVPSIKEGFGLTIPEAGLMGTPSVAYNVEGLRDIIKNNGLLVEPNVSDLANGIGKLLNDKNLYFEMRTSAQTYARALDWDLTAKKRLEIL